MAEGFVAAGAAEERTCPDVQAEVLVAIADVTAPIFAAGPGKIGEDFAAARQTAIANAEREACAGDPRFRCQVISFYQGGQFKLYKYRRYADVRLVFAPEFDAAWFGGDPDNFNFPRYDLDCAFLRLYEDGKPAATPDFLAWSTAAPQAGEPVFVSGNPGVTERRLTVAQLQALRDTSLPLLTAEMAELRGRLIQLGDQGPAMRRLVASDLVRDREQLQGARGAADGAARSRPSWRRGRGDEADLKARLATDPKLAADIGDPWSRDRPGEQAYARQFVVWHELEAGAGGGSDLFRYARELVRGAAERAKPSGVRLPEYADCRLALRREAAGRSQAARAGAGAAAAGVLALQDPRAAGRRRPGGDHPARDARAPRGWPSGWSPARSSAIRPCARRCGTAAWRRSPPPTTR